MNFIFLSLFFLFAVFVVSVVGLFVVDYRLHKIFVELKKLNNT